jgi:hypothetical protein
VTKSIEEPRGTDQDVKQLPEAGRHRYFAVLRSGSLGLVHALPAEVVRELTESTTNISSVDSRRSSGRRLSAVVRRGR